MTSRPRHLLLVALAALLVLTPVPATGAAVSTGHDDPASVARRHLSDDATGPVQLRRDASARVRSVGTRAGQGIRNPDVGPGTSVGAAARAHLTRYGAALGAAPRSTFVRRATVRTVSGVDAVSYVQEIDGLPVVGGSVVVSMAPDRTLRSLVASVSSGAPVGDATVSSDTAARTARAVVARATRAAHLVVSGEHRAVLDPTVVQVSLPNGPRTVWQVEVGDGAGVRQLVLVDDRTGSVLLRVDLIAHANRVVCDRANARGSDTTCTTGFARAEGDAPVSTPADVNTAYDLSGVVSDFYLQVAGTDLTELLGVQTSVGARLASTVRFCPPLGEGSCPYANAFWNGQQMFYGAGWAGADDVVGHEMTHGFVDQYSQLFYWGQSGAINESMADVIGEIIDHRRGADDDSGWLLGEDLPVGAIRSLANPPAKGQPDSMSSSDYDDDPTYADSGGVHTNSGVGNKTAFLISQGGTFNGQTIAGIDGADTGLTKTATLYVDVIQRLSSGADFADLGAQLDQSCQDLLAKGTAGFTSATCVAVHSAGLATQLATPPAKAAPATDAPTTCPAGTTKRVLLDSESPATAFAPAGTGWSRESAAGSSNATSGIASWFAEDPGGATASSSWIQTNTLRSSASIALPVGQQSYLSFANWYAFDYDINPTRYYDGGTVELGVDGGVPAIGSTNGGPWVNGPDRILESGSGNTGAGQPAFSGDSHGWSVSRLDLTPLAGHTVRPQFTMRSDNQFGFIGWYLDDIRVYTCDPPPPPASAPRSMKVYGGVHSATITWSPPATNLAQLDHYLVIVESTALRVPATATSLRVPAVTHSLSKIVPRVAAVSKDGTVVWGPSQTVPHPRPSLKARRSGARLTFKGRLATGPTLQVPIVDAAIRLQRRTSSGWVNVKTVRTRTDGTYVVKVKHRKRATYRAVSLGRLGLIGHISVARRW